MTLFILEYPGSKENIQYYCPMSLIGAYEGVGIVGIVVALVAPDITAVELVTTDTTVSFSLTLIHAQIFSRLIKQAIQS